MVRTYLTTFPATENPISESSKWTNGAATGLDWTNVRTTPNKAFGTEPGDSVNPYDDSIATLQTGSWGNDQAAEGTVYITSTPAWAAEVELLLRFAITAHSAAGYEFNASCNPGVEYLTIVRWDGALGSFTNLATRNDRHVVNGDIIGFKSVSGTLSAYLNGVLVLGPVLDTTFPGGSPGVGFFLDNQTGNNANYGLSRYAVNDAGILPSLLVLTGMTAGRSC